MTDSIINPIVTDTASLRASIQSVPAAPVPGHDYSRPVLPTINTPCPRARTLDQFHKPEANDPGELLKHRFLCRGGGLLLVGATGLGKSSLSMQLMIKWALGEAAFGLEPARPIKSLLIQSENDDGDLAEMKLGVFNGLNLSPEDQAKASRNILVYQESCKAGGELCAEVLDPLLQEVKPDLLWIDPALAYIGGDMNKQEDVGKFLRNDIAPLLIKHHCGAIIIHHTNKISKDPEKQQADVSYLGAGSAEWINWCRAMLALRKIELEDLYELVAAKRGARLKWKAADGESISFKKYIGHSKTPDIICWHEMAIAKVEELRVNNGKGKADVLKHVPQIALIAKDDLKEICKRNDIGKNLFDKLVNELVNDEKLFKVEVPRPSTRPIVLVSRKPEIVPPGTTLADCTQDSQGHYFLPSPPEPTKKAL